MYLAKTLKSFAVANNICGMPFKKAAVYGRKNVVVKVTRSVLIEDYNKERSTKNYIFHGT